MTKQDLRMELRQSKNTLPFLTKRLSEGSFILVLGAALFILLSLISYPTSSIGWLPVHQAKAMNAGGQVGAYIAYALFYVSGYFSFLLPITIAYGSWILLREQRFQQLDKAGLYLRSAGFLLLLITLCGVLSIKMQQASAGGIIGYYTVRGLTFCIGFLGTELLLIAGLLTGITWLTGLSWIFFLEKTGYYTLILMAKLLQGLRWLGCYAVVCIQKLKKIQWKKPVSHAPKAYSEEKEKPTLPPLFTSPPIVEPKIAINTIVSEEASLISESLLAPEPLTIKEKKVKIPVTDGFPSMNLLDKSKTTRHLQTYSHQDLEAVSRDVEQHLLDFGIQADVVAVHPGPVITRFELQLAAGIKVSRLTSLSKDLARSLSVISVRIVEVIPGKTVVGIELPNAHREVVRLAEVLTTEVYQQAHSALTLALGVDIAGHPMIVDLAKMPHLLVAGTTGSGKSVGINAMILSLLYKASPDQVRLIMIDPKMLELSVYDGIPHLLTPVVTDMKEAASALRWCVAEMERRYRLMAALGVRNVSGYNIKVTEGLELGKPLADPLWKPIDSLSIDPPLLETLPYIVVIIDELADMMMVVGKKVEQLIARIAQKARAAGIHLILATQRPSVDVLTGLIKSNIPTRMSFQVSSKIDSRTILDQQGAEQLLGHGDMLYLAPGTGAPLRVHGAFVDDEEVHRVADDWRSRGEPEYIDEITQIFEPGEPGAREEGEAVEDADPLYDQAVEFIIQTRKASISSVQRKFKIGYNRAARLVEEMERTGIVGPLEGGLRDVLVSTVEGES